MKTAITCLAFLALPLSAWVVIGAAFYSIVEGWPGPLWLLGGLLLGASAVEWLLEA